VVVENHPVRPWRGVSPEQRVAGRREQVLDAALEVFTAKGFTNSRVRDVCRQAGLTERYFYESFPNKEALLVSLAYGIVTDLVAAAQPGIALVETDIDRAIDVMSHAVVGSLTDDPRRARILFVEVVGVNRTLEDQRRVVIAGLVDVIRAGAARAYGDWVRESQDVELIARALIGAAQELLVAYIRDELEMDQEALSVNVGRLFQRSLSVLNAMNKEQQT
jgi:AcrR family transcriptional regulator